MPRRFQCISALIADITYVRITFTLAVTALSGVRVAINGMSALTLDRPLLLLPGEEVGQADHPAKVEVEAVVMGPPGGPSGGAPTERVLWHCC